MEKHNKTLRQIGRPALCCFADLEISLQFSYLSMLEFLVSRVHLVAVAPHQVDGVRERRLHESEALGRGFLAAGKVDDDGAASGSGSQS